ncbi:hypothetical protein [Runella salmonicolor]|uniref:Uncharacterized protein n=1 Tax=Runella salmonicolor TaxID=2950278 RepID=A0ABT1FSP4_9BACT|nr:hypothetical protein [Runella salmonicolor]MCP1384727.1 hypothetical protein [Runella salmonicolor]
MKKLLIITNLAWAATFFMSFKSEPVSQQKPCDQFCYDYSNSVFSGLSLSEAKELTGLYSKNHYPSYTRGMQSGFSRKLVDSKSVWFSLETLKKFIYQIERFSCQNCGQKAPALGVRIYFGEYSGTTGTNAALPGFQNLPREYAGLHTLMMVPTIKQKNKNVDFDPLASYNQGKCEIRPLSEYLKGLNKSYIDKSINELQYNNAMAFKAVILSPEVSAQNHGGLCPPVCQNEDTAFPNQ